MDNRDPCTYAMNGAALVVHNELRCGFLEAVYHEALAAEVNLPGNPFLQQVEVALIYKVNDYAPNFGQILFVSTR